MTVIGAAGSAIRRGLEALTGGAKDTNGSQGTAQAQAPASEAKDCCSTPSTPSTTQAQPDANAKEPVSPLAQADARAVHQAKESAIAAQFQQLVWRPGESDAGIVEIGYKPKPPPKPVPKPPPPTRPGGFIV